MAIDISIICGNITLVVRLAPYLNVLSCVHEKKLIWNTRSNRTKKPVTRYKKNVAVKFSPEFMFLSSTEVIVICPQRPNNLTI